VGRVEDVTKAVKEVRTDELGLHWKTLAKQKKLLDELGTDDPRVGVALLTALLQRLDDDAIPIQQQDATILRWAMAVDCLPIKNVTARREAVRKQLRIESHNTVLAAEKRAISRLVALILDEADKRKALSGTPDSFTKAVPQASVLPEVPEPDWDALAIDWRDLARRRLRRLRIFLTARGVSLVAMLAFVTFAFGPYWSPSFIIVLAVLAAVLGRLLYEMGWKDDGSGRLTLILDAILVPILKWILEPSPRRREY
jgi:hypothetical protein